MSQINNRVISSDEHMSAYLQEKHSDLSAINPGRGFELIWKRGPLKPNGNHRCQIAIIPLDGMGDLLHE